MDRKGGGDVIRECANGKIQGWKDADGIEIYYGIPYAESPIGMLRWKPPAEKQDWDGILDATRAYPIPYQKEGYFLNGSFQDFQQSEDVLYVNIWTNGNGKKKPVYVWFHGGAFQGGYGYDPMFKGSSFAKQDIVFVSVEYRCGVFGFLAHPELSEESDEKTSGNYGLMDQLAALRWIQKNIAHFEGDPDCVTIGGQSAGGASVYMLMHMPQAKGLFHRAIIESGIIDEERQSLKEAEAKGMELQRRLNCRSVDELRKLDGSIVFEASFNLEKTLLSQGVMPCTDNVYIKEDQTYDADIPVLMGCNSREGIMFFSKMDTEGYRSYLSRKYGERASLIFEEYPASSDDESLSQCRIVESQSWLVSTEKYLAQRVREKKEPVYMYYFPHCSQTLQGEVLEANHSGELWYVFDCMECADWKVTDADRYLANIMNRYWAGFIKQGKPAAPDQPEWPPFNEKDSLRMCFGDGAEVKSIPYHKKLWQLLK